MRKIAILVCIAAAPFLFALNPALASQDTESEAKAIFRTWKSQDAHPETGPWDEYKKDPIVGAIWQDLTPTRDQLWINSKDVTRNGGVVTFWMRGDYSDNMKVKYRTALWRIRIYCAERTVTILATSTYAADGTPIEERDYPRASSTAIRPDTTYDEIAKKLCI